MSSTSTSNEQDSRFVSRLTRDTLALIMAGGRGSRLMQMTLSRAKPAVPFGGKFRIIDFTLSNCINSGIRRVGVLTQYKSHSLIRHLQQGWGFLRGQFGEFIELLPAEQRGEAYDWYSGTADSVYQNLDFIRRHQPAYVLVLAGDHIYKMDYGPMLAQHARTGAQVTVGCIEVPAEEASGFGVMQVDAANRVVEFQEKPQAPHCLADKPGVALASMGIYVFDARFLLEQLSRDAGVRESSHDFGKDVVPALIAGGKVYAYRFSDLNEPGRQGYWRDVGTIDSYWLANIELTYLVPELNLYDARWPIWTLQEQVPPAKFVHDEDGRRGKAVSSLVSGGCIISGAGVRNSLLFTGVRINSYSRIEQAVILPYVNIARSAKLKRVVIDRGVHIPEGLVIGEDPDDPQVDGSIDALEADARADAQLVLAGERGGDDRAVFAAGIRAEQSAIGQRQVVDAGFSRRVDADDRDRSRQGTRPERVGAEVGPADEGRGGHVDAGDRADGRERVPAQAGLAERCHREVGATEGRRDGSIDGRVDPGGRRQAGRQHRDPEGDPDRGQDRPQRAGAQPAPGQLMDAAHRRSEPELGESRDERRRVVIGSPPQLDGVADPPVTDDEHTVGVGGRLRIVGHQDDRLVPLLARPPERVEDLGPGRVVEVAGRLVGEEEGRSGDQGAGHRDPLLLAGRQLVGLVVLLAGQFDRGDHVPDPLGQLAA